MKRLLSALFALPFAGGALAAPVQGTVRAGTAAIAKSGANTTITQSSDRAVIDWRSFDIASGESVTFNQPGTQSAVLNRVTGTQFSSLQGTLSANGQVYLVNPNGILIGNGATLNASAFVASTANIGTDAFMRAPADANGRYAFNELTAAASRGSIVNEGAISVSDGGLVALVAPAVRNSGTITARLGTVEIASANRFTLDLFGDDLVRIAVDDMITAGITGAGAQVDVSGTIEADGGRIVLLSVPAASGIVDQAINVSGIVRARTAAAGDRGEIHLLANDGAVTIAGTLDATAAAQGAGGEITAIGANVRVASSGRVNASGAGGGGFVVLGGELQASPAERVTERTFVESGGTVQACGTVGCTTEAAGGAGGEVRLYSSNGTQLAGEIDVSGSAEAQAGTVEVLSDRGLTQLSGSSQIIAITGTDSQTGLDLPAGFAVIIGDTLAVHPNALITMYGVSTAFPYPSSTQHTLYDSANPNIRQYVLDENVDPRTTTQPLVFHAYSSDDYTSQLGTFDDPIPRIVASGWDTPVGALRPSGGTPATLAAAAADPLAAIPIAFAPAALPQATDAATQLVQEERSRESPALQVGGRGVAALADLGRGGDEAGASPDVFGTNYHVLAPSQTAGDAPVADYLCTTPYSRNSCSSDQRILNPGDVLDPQEVTRLLGPVTRTRSIVKTPTLALRIQFDLDSAQVPQESRPQLEAVAAGIRALTDAPHIVVEGHADATGSTQHNEALSLRRAEAVRTHLVELGVNPDWLAARGAGSRVPLIADRPDAPENRRVEFRRED